MKKKYIVLLCILMFIIIGSIIGSKIIHNHNSYVILNSNGTDELWHEYDTYINNLKNNIDEINNKNYKDEKINSTIVVFIKNFYENHKDNSAYSNSFYELRFMKKIKKDFFPTYLHYKEYRVLEYYEIFSVETDVKYEILNNYLEAYSFCEQYINRNNLNFEQIINLKIIEIQTVNSMAVWLLNNSL